MIIKYSILCSAGICLKEDTHGAVAEKQIDPNIKSIESFTWPYMYSIDKMHEITDAVWYNNVLNFLLKLWNNRVREFH